MIMFILCFLFACKQIILPKPQWSDLRYRATIAGSFSPDDTQDVPPAVLAAIPQTTLDIDWTLSFSPMQRHNDDSLTVRLTVVQANNTHNGNKLESAPIEGKYIDVRIFETGELLDYKYAEHWAHEDRYGDVFDLLLGVLFPNPPRVETSKPSPKILRWPLRYGQGTGGRHGVSALWSFDRAEENSVFLSYSGKWHTDGRWKKFSLLGRGEANGQLVISELGGLIEGHTIDWNRKLCYGLQQQICQKQRFVGEVKRIR